MAYAIGSWAGRLTFALVGACFIWMGSCETRASAQAADYPSQQIQVIVPFPAGGSADYFARSIFNRLSSVVGQRIVIENKAGAGGIIGVEGRHCGATQWLYVAGVCGGLCARASTSQRAASL